MRTNEKTYLQKLVQDIDRKCDLHQIGCDYLSYDENIERLFDVLIKPNSSQADLKKKLYKKLSAPICSGYDRRFIVGYLDLYLSRGSDGFLSGDQIFVEVKGHPQHPHDILQQMQTYMSYLQMVTPVLATMYPISKSEKQLYLDHEIKHIWIDPDKARAFVEARTGELDKESF